MAPEQTQTVIGKTIIIKGDIQGDEALTIEGKVEGKIQLESTIYVKESGVVNADISSHSITIEGAVSGNITATEKVEIMPNGIMVGDIKAPRVVINDGALLKGQVEMEVTDEKIRAKRDGAAPSKSLPTSAPAARGFSSIDDQ